MIKRTHKAVKAIADQVKPPQEDDHWSLLLDEAEREQFSTFWASIEHKIADGDSENKLEQLTDEELDELQGWMKLAKKGRS